MIKIISLNIEKDRHFEKHKKFFLDEKADIICFQEIFKEDIEKYKKLLKMNYFCFSPMVYSKSFINPTKTSLQGIAILSKYEIKSFEDFDIFEIQKKRKFVTNPVEFKNMNRQHWKLLFISANIKNKIYNIITTHAPVTKRGDYITEFQRKYFKNLKNILKNKDSFILTGDFNTSRKAELFRDLASIYICNIPKKYKTSIDNKIHREGYKNIQHVVDGFFTTKDIKVKKIKYQDGVSDHFAVVAEIE